MPGILVIGGTVPGTDLNANRDVALDVSPESREAREQAPAAGFTPRGDDLRWLEDRTAARKRHSAEIRSLLGELEASVVLDARRRETLATTRISFEVLAIMLNNKKRVLPAGRTRGARQGARLSVRAVEARPGLLGPLTRHMGF
ncbi:MAG: hypothetical protein NZR01_08835 [Bryobacteraceae bacterium]|nr:hypothetical protein [Bryobacteraceae bacterium]